MSKLLRNLLAAMATGFLLFLAMPGTSEISICGWFALVPLLIIATGTSTSPGKAAGLGLASGMVFYPLALSWITIVLGTYGHLDWWLTGSAVLLLSLYMSLYLAAFTAGCRWCANRLPLPLFAPILWVGLDYLRARLLTGFPWLDLGYSQFQNSLILQNADLLGHHGVTFLLVMTNALLVSIFTLVTNKVNQKRIILTAILPATILLVGSVGYGIIRQQQITTIYQNADDMIVSVAQGNIPQDEKWSASFKQETVNRYLTLSEQALNESYPPSLLIWPETALPFYPLESPYFAKLVEQLVSNRHANLLVGAPHRQRPVPNAPTEYFNSAFLIIPANHLISGMRLPLAQTPPMAEIKGRYDKQHLVPLGEYIPLRSILPFLAPVVETIGDFTPGQPIGPIPCENARIGVLICFESIFPELARNHVANGANLLVNITNDGWFGRSNAPWQHLSMAVFRAVENRRSLARAANTGISACFDPLGHATKLSQLFAVEQITARLPLLTIETIFTRYGHHFGLFCFLALLPLGALIQRTKKTDQEN